MKRRRQNQKFPSFQIFRLAAGGVGGAANKNDGKFLGFAPRELVERGRGAKVNRFVQNAFERSYIIPQSYAAAPQGRFCICTARWRKQTALLPSGIERRSITESADEVASQGREISSATAEEIFLTNSRHF